MKALCGQNIITIYTSNIDVLKDVCLWGSGDNEIDRLEDFKVLTGHLSRLTLFLVIISHVMSGLEQ